MRLPYGVLAYVLALVLPATTLAASSAAALFAPAVSTNELDYAVSGIIRSNGFKPLTPDRAAAVFKREGDGWWAALGEMQNPSTNPLTFHYRLAFHKPMDIGSMFVRPDGRSRGAMSFRFLKPQAPYPGDPNDPAQWEPLPTIARGGHYECAFPPGTATRVLLGTHVTAEYSMSVLHQWSLTRSRLHSLTPSAVAQAERVPGGDDPAVLLRGDEWHNAVRDDEGHVARHPVSRVEPAWFSLVWKEQQTLTAARVGGNADEIGLYAYTGDDRANPALAPARDWRRLALVSVARETTDTEARHLVAFAPVQTRALKLVALETRPRNQPIWTLSEFSAYTDLGAAPVPAASAGTPSVPPCQVPFRLARAGETALVVDDSRGRRLRNLFAQVPLGPGEHGEPWDLRDERGDPVPPGTYTWKTISAPPLELRYELTPYPNVEQHSPDSTPWNRGPKDGWLSNHGNQCAVCVVGDKVCIAAGGTEGGHAFIETDFGGAKQWGTPDGMARLFSDGRTLYGEAGGTVKRCDTAQRQWQDLFSTRPTEQRRGEVAGMAARDGKIYVAFTGALPYFDSPADASAVDGDHVIPPRKPLIQGAGDYGLDLAPLRDLLSLFRLGGHISGEPRTQIYIETTRGTGRQQRTVLPFKRPVAIGSLILPIPEDLTNRSFRISVLKPDAAYPPDPRKEADWINVESGALGAWNCVTLPPGTLTRALRLTFARPDATGGDLAEENADARAGTAPSLDDAADGDVLGAQKRPEWKGRLEGLRLLRMRFASRMGTARVRVNSGTFDPATGVWDARRTEPLSERKPGIFALEWDAPTTLRGLAIKEIDGECTEIDVYTGPATGSIDIDAQAGWTNVATYFQPRRNYYKPDPRNNVIARYLDGTVDFGKDWETRAVRLRVVRQWSDRGGSPQGVRLDRGADTLDPTRCRVYGVAPLAYLGGEPPVDPLLTRRLTVYDGKTGKAEQAFPSQVTGAIAFHPSGALYGLRDRTVVKVNPATGDTTPFVSDLQDPRLLDIDGKGRFYVFDQAPERRVVRVYDANGTFVRNIGTPGPRRAGAYDPASLHEICALSVDRAGDFIWLVYPHEDPRRVIKFRTDGTFEADYLGNTHYGGGGILDPFDKSRLWYKDVLFHLDWEKGTSSIRALVSLNYWEASPWGPCFRPDWHPIPANGRLYLAAPGGRMGSVYLFDEKKLTVRMAAAFGAAAAFEHLKNDDVTAHLGGKPLDAFNFIWADRNGDGAVQVPEVEFSPRAPEESGLGPFDRSLGVCGMKKRYEVSEFLADGTPVYTVRPLPFTATFRLDNGTYWKFAEGANEVLAADGTRVWSYRAKQGMDGLKVYPWRPGAADLQFGLSGHATADSGDLGEFVVVHANTGQMNLWTADGFLAGHITYHTLDPRATGWPAEHRRGTRLDGLSLGQEHFHHYFCKTEQDHKYYIVAGHSWISLIEVKGLEQFRRESGTFTVTADMLERTRKWENERARKAAFAAPPLLESAPLENAELKGAAETEIRNVATFKLAYDTRNLYLNWEIKPEHVGVFANGGEDFHRCFKTGAAVDFQLGTNPRADPDRAGAAAGDLRVVIAPGRGRGAATAVLYRPVAPGTPPDQAWSTSTPAGGTVAFDQVAVLRRAEVKVEPAVDWRHTVLVTAVLPLDELGLKIVPDTLYRMDWGVLGSRDGFSTTSRRYWANTSATGVSDEPTEARLTPNLWGYLRFVTPKDALALPGAETKHGDEDGVEEVIQGGLKPDL